MMATDALLARPPCTEHDKDVTEVHRAALVEVLRPALVPPGGEDDDEVVGTDEAVVVAEWTQDGPAKSQGSLEITRPAAGP